MMPEAASFLLCNIFVFISLYESEYVPFSPKFLDAGQL
jgi:hypothetical protein